MIDKNIRPCFVRSMSDKNKKEKAIFHGFSMRAYPNNSVLQGNLKAQVAIPVAIVEYEDGKLYDVDVRRVTFIDSKAIFTQFNWLS